MIDRIFVDSNIWVYLFIKDDETKSRKAKEYITKSAQADCLVISYQVVNEVCRVLKKNEYTEPEIRSVADDMMELCEICGYSAEIIIFASELRERYLFSYWDSLIVASALTSRCDVLASEDMHEGLKIDNMVFVNVVA